MSYFKLYFRVNRIQDPGSCFFHDSSVLLVGLTFKILFLDDLTIFPNGTDNLMPINPVAVLHREIEGEFCKGDISIDGGIMKNNIIDMRDAVRYRHRPLHFIFVIVAYRSVKINAFTVGSEV